MLSVHADPSVPHDRIAGALGALEEARARLATLGWPTPVQDGLLGGDAGIDLYMTTSSPAAAYSDGLVPWTYLDRASVFAVVDPATPTEWLDACVTAAYAEALLLSADPAEARTWRRATAAWLAWELTGRFGCEDAVPEQQAEPFRSWISDASHDGAGGALFLAYLSARHSEGSTRFVRDVWDLARQRTWEGEGLRAEPDLVVGLRGRDRDERRPLARQHRGPRSTALVRRKNRACRPCPRRDRQRCESSNHEEDDTAPNQGERCGATTPVRKRVPGDGRAGLDGGERPSCLAARRVWRSLVARSHPARLARQRSSIASMRRARPSRREPICPIELREDTARVLFVVTQLSKRASGR